MAVGSRVGFEEAPNPQLERKGKEQKLLKKYVI